MKKSFQICFAFFACIYSCSFLTAQSSYYFPDSGAVWTMDGVRGDGSIPCQVDLMWTDRLGPGTVVSNRTYHDLWRSASIYCGGQLWCGGWMAYHIGIVSHDSTGKAWLQANGVQQAYPLYDMAKNVGDTMMSVYFDGWWGGSTVATIDSVDSVMIGGTMRKRQHINAPFPLWIVEGMGTAGGLVDVQIGLDQTNNLVCHSLNGSSVWTAPQSCYHTTGSACEVLIGIEDEEAISPLTVSPQPAQDRLKLDLGEVSLEEMQGQLIDLQGRRVYRFAVPAGRREYRIDLPSLSDGIYYVLVEAPGSPGTRRGSKVWIRK
jgi:hypothetical protein